MPVLAALDDGGDGGFDAIVGKHQFDFDFGQEIDRVFAAAIDFSVAFLAAESFDFADGHAFDADFAEGVLHFLQLEWLDDRFDFLHNCVQFTAPTVSGSTKRGRRSRRPGNGTEMASQSEAATESPANKTFRS